MFGLPSSSEGFIIKGLTHTENQDVLSYACMRIIIVLDALERINFEFPRSNLVYSRRTGGATAAADSGVPEMLFPHYGRWRSERVKDDYVKDIVKSLPAVSHNVANLSLTFNFQSFRFLGFLW